MLGLYLFFKAFAWTMKAMMFCFAVMLLISIGVVLAALAVIGLVLITVTNLIIEWRHT